MRIKKLRVIATLTSLALLISAYMLYFHKCDNKDTIIEPHITLYRHQENEIIKLKMEDYIIGTVAAEMPASFELEALKAQAVCARTYALRKLIDGKRYKLEADLSDNIYECQAYISKEEFCERHPANCNELYKKIEAACQQTRGEIMLYAGKPIDALYHSTCGGKTENAYDVWGNDIPYLRSVKCGYCEQSPKYETVQVFSYQDLNHRLGLNNGINPGNSVKILKKTETGRTKKLQINEQVISAEEVRLKCNFPSTWWTIKKKDDKIIINSRGYGHGLGMCQFGANGFALKNKNYHDILEKYYKNISFYTMAY